MLVNTGHDVPLYLLTTPQSAVYPAAARRRWRSCVLHVILEDVDYLKSFDDRGKMAGKPSKELECSLLRHLKASPFELIDDCVSQSLELLPLNAKNTCCRTANCTARP